MSAPTRPSNPNVDSALALLLARLEAQRASWDRQLFRSSAIIALAITVLGGLGGIWAAVVEGPGIWSRLALGATIGSCAFAVLVAGLALFVQRINSGVAPGSDVLDRIEEPGIVAEWCTMVRDAFQENVQPLALKAKWNQIALYLFLAEFTAAALALLFILV